MRTVEHHQHCAHCKTSLDRAQQHAICRSCAEIVRCDVCHGPVYRVSLLTRRVEPLDHLECMLLHAAA